MLDADHFKKVNDNWGHETGNQALQFIASCIINNIRKLDIACRYGGEEFAIILPSCELSTSICVAERIRTSIEKTPIKISTPDGNHNQFNLTASVGIAVYSGKTPISNKQLVDAADTQLYQAKQQGRNRICGPLIKEDNRQVSIDEKAALLTYFNPHNSSFPS
jgi:diguanylate cyclase (GGDEF)-like protein